MRLIHSFNAINVNGRRQGKAERVSDIYEGIRHLVQTAYEDGQVIITCGGCRAELTEASYVAGVGHRPGCQWAVPGEECDECGSVIPGAEPSMVNRFHADSCSLYPANCAGPARTAARVAKGDQVRFAVQYGTGPVEFTGRVTRVWDKGATLAGRPRRMARIASGGKYYERNVDDLATILTATVGPEVPPPPGFTKTRWELAIDQAASELVTLGFTDEAARRLLDGADSTPRCAVRGRAGGLDVEVVRQASGGYDVTARPTDAEAWPEPSLSDLARRYMRAPGQVTLAEYKRLRESGMVTADGQLRSDDAPDGTAGGESSWNLVAAGLAAREAEDRAWNKAVSWHRDRHGDTPLRTCAENPCRRAVEVRAAGGLAALRAGLVPDVAPGDVPGLASREQAGPFAPAADHQVTDAAPGLEILEGFQLVQSDDEVKRDLELTCLTCGLHVCDAEPDDTLGTLAKAAARHEHAYAPLAFWTRPRESHYKVTELGTWDPDTGEVADASGQCIGSATTADMAREVIDDTLSPSNTVYWRPAEPEGDDDAGAGVWRPGCGGAAVALKN